MVGLMGYLNCRYDVIMIDGCELYGCVWMAWQKGKKGLTKLPCDNSLTKTLRCVKECENRYIEIYGYGGVCCMMCVNEWMAWLGRSRYSFP